MKCQKCGANNANTHVKTVINGEIKEYDLCSECAKKMGYTNIFGNFEDEFSELLGSFFCFFFFVCFLVFNEIWLHFQLRYL